MKIPIHKKIEQGYAAEGELFDDLWDEMNELHMARRDWLRMATGDCTVEWQHMRKEIVDVFLVAYGYLVYHSDNKDDANDFIQRVIFDNIQREKYSESFKRQWGGCGL